MSHRDSHPPEEEDFSDEALDRFYHPYTSADEDESLEIKHQFSGSGIDDAQSTHQRERRARIITGILVGVAVVILCVSATMLLNPLSLWLGWGSSPYTTNKITTPTPDLSQNTPSTTSTPPVQEISPTPILSNEPTVGPTKIPGSSNPPNPTATRRPTATPTKPPILPTATPVPVAGTSATVSFHASRMPQTGSYDATFSGTDCQGSDCVRALGSPGDNNSTYHDLISANSSMYGKDTTFVGASFHYDLACNGISDTLCNGVISGYAQDIGVWTNQVILSSKKGR
jgi:hypothetical protein